MNTVRIEKNWLRWGKIQYGFRERRSTVDAILRVRSLSEYTGVGGVALAVSLDIVNAFNSLPWDRIGEAIYYFGFPEYLREVVWDYFRDRTLSYTNRAEVRQRRGVYCGVPQGSVLSSLLWDIGYAVLRTGLPPGSSVVYYADDTLVLSRGDNWEEAVAAPNQAVAGVMRAIERVGLEVAPPKTEALFFHDESRGEPPRALVLVDGTRVVVGPTIKYLGLVLDGLWGFRPHFEALAPRVGRVVNKLSRLLPNVGGPGVKARSLYTNTVLPVTLYGAPVWADEMCGDRCIKLMHRSMRIMCIRIVRSYRTVSFLGAGALAGVPPLELLAQQYSWTFQEARRLQRESRPPDTETILRLRRETRAATLVA
jgi:hypothetical protein